MEKGTFKFKFDVIVGALHRNRIRTHLKNSKSNIEYDFPGTSINIREDKSLLDSHFFIQGFGLPVEVKDQVESWINNFKP